MPNVIVKDGIAVYGPDVRLTAGYADGGRFRDTTTSSANADVVEVDALPEYFVGGAFQLSGGALTLIPERADSLPVDLETLAAERRAARITALEAAREAGFAYNGATVASDLKSQMLIQGSAQLAQLAIAQGTQQALDQFAATLGAGWRAIDGTVVATSASDVIAMAQALAAHVAQCDGVSQVHKAAINDAVAAEDLAALYAIDPTAGYA